MPKKAYRTRMIVALSAGAVLATGCSTMADRDNGDNSGGDSGGGDGATVTLSFANSYTTAHPHTRCGIQAVADDVNGRDVGLEIETFPNSELGDDSSRFTSVMSGDLDMDVQGSSALADTYAPVGVLDMAYAFDGPDHLFEFFDGETGEDLKEDFAERTGARVLDVWYFGMRHFTANRAIREPADLDGLRIRFPDSRVYLENAKALGANATAVAFEEVYLSLQQGIVDGQENPIPTIAEQSFDEVQSHVSLSGHQTGSQLIVINEDRWQELSEEQREALQTAVSDARPENRGCIEENEAEILEEWAEEGSVTVVEDVDRETFSRQAEEYFGETLPDEQRELYEAVRASAG